MPVKRKRVLGRNDKAMDVLKTPPSYETHNPTSTEKPVKKTSPMNTVQMEDKPIPKERVHYM